MKKMELEEKKSRKRENAERTERKEKEEGRQDTRQSHLSCPFQCAVDRKSLQKNCIGC
jgi:hypothetical protein